MYHVTKQREQDNRPNWDTIEPHSVANDKTYDGDILGLPLASFTTTLNEYNDVIDLPTISPYPRNINRTFYSGNHHRVKIKFNINHYCFFSMAENSTPSNITQIQLLCIRKSDDRDSFEDKVYGILLQHYRKKKLTKQLLNKYFPNGQANVYN